MNKYQEEFKKIYEIIYNSYDDWGIPLEILVKLEKLQEAIEKANKYDEKETPKKPIERLFEKNKHLKVCPSCWEKDIKTFVCGKYCDECGQRLER